MSPARFAEVKDLVALAALTPGEAADRASEWLGLQSQCAGFAAELVAHVHEVEQREKHLKLRVEDLLKMGRELATERDRLQALLDLENDRVDGTLFRALKAQLLEARAQLRRRMA